MTSGAFNVFVSYGETLTINAQWIDFNTKKMLNNYFFSLTKYKSFYLIRNQEKIIHKKFKKRKEKK